MILKTILIPTPPPPPRCPCRHRHRHRFQSLYNKPETKKVTNLPHFLLE